MPAFNGPLNHSNPSAKLLELAAHGVRGIGIFNTVAERNSLSVDLRSSPYLAYMCNDDKLYVYDGPRQSVVGLQDKLQLVDLLDWQNTSNWTVVGAGSGTEVNDLTSSVTWADVPDANITESSVTQHQGALSIAQSQVTGLTGAGGTLTSLQDQITLNDGDIATNAGGISANAQAITTLQTDVSSNDTDIQQLQADLAAEISATNSDVSNLQSQITGNDGDITSLQSDVSGIQTELDTTQAGAGLAVNGVYAPSQSSNYINSATTLFGADILLDTQIKTNETNISAINTTIGGLDTDDISEGATNLYNVQADWSATSGDTSEILNKPSSFPPSSHTHSIAQVSGLQSNLNSLSGSVFVNASNIAANSSNISSLDTRITAAEGDITTNASDIATNATNIASNATDIAANATAIQANDTDIAANLSAIQANDTDIAANATAISNEATARANADTTLQGQISTNASDISTNAGDIATNVSAIASNTTHSGITSGNPHGTSITNLVGVPSTLGSYKNVLTVHQNGTELEYSDLIEEITNEVLDLVNSSTSYSLNSADLDGDGVVGVNDLLELLGQFGQQGVDSPFLAAWDLNDSDSSLSYAGSSNESDQFGAPSDSTTNLLILEAPAQVSAYSPWSITTNTNNETVTINQTSGNSAGSVEYNKDLDFQDPLTLEVQQTESTPTVYHVFLKAVYSYPTASDLTIWHPLGSFSHDLANYDPASTSGTEKVLPVMSIEDILSHTSAGTSGDEYPSSVTMSFRYMKPAEGGNGYVRLKRAHFQWKS